MRFDLSNCRFAFLDLETTGLSPWFGDRICQVGIVQTEGKRIKQTFELLINPEHPLSPAAARANGFTDEQLAGAPRFSEVMDEVDAALQDSVIVCHNAKFDLGFLDSESRRLGREIQIPNLIDTLLMARQYFQLPSYSLGSLAEAFDVPLVDEHPLRGLRGAQADALSTRNVFFGMMDALKELNKPLDDYIGIYNSPAWPDEGVQLPTELGEAIYSGKPIFIRYVNKEGEQSQRWVTPMHVIGLADYIYLQAYCHLREAERSFRLDRIVEVRVEA
ncbi:MAG: exonuclease domain-containing protein [Gammaproteobacteria bacterium]